MDISNHPCFNDSARHQYGRIHLPVAPACNIQCNFCDRKFDCLNESRPGVTSSILTPKQALGYLKKAMDKIPNITVVGIAGPGDPFANADKTLETLRLVRAEYPDMLLCVATNGLELGRYADELAEIGISHITVTMNAVYPAVAEKIYSWVKLDKKIYRGLEAAEILLEKQAESIQKIKAKGIVVKINTVVIPGINDGYISAVASEAQKMGADMMNCIPLYHVEGTAFGDIQQPDHQVMEKIRSIAKLYLPQMSHCSRCRADAAGLIGDSTADEIMNLLKKSSETAADPSNSRPYIAVASYEGLFVNQHLGEAEALWIYGRMNGQIVLVEKRKTPTPGSGVDRWLELGTLLNDCREILVSGVGANPKNVLEGMDLKITVMEGLVRDALETLFSGKEIPKIMVKPAGKCGIGSCGGTGGGC